MAVRLKAYLGACAISLLARRLRNPDDVGTDTLMRYTLRLLTAQQFLRASSLVCVLEAIREEHSDVLGTESFSIRNLARKHIDAKHVEEGCREARGTTKRCSTGERLPVTALPVVRGSNGPHTQG